MNNSKSHANTAYSPIRRPQISGSPLSPCASINLTKSESDKGSRGNKRKYGSAHDHVQSKSGRSTPPSIRMILFNCISAYRFAHGDLPYLANLSAFSRPNRYDLLYPSSPSTPSRHSPCLLRAAGVPRRMSFILWNVDILRWSLILVNHGGSVGFGAGRPDSRRT